MSRRRREVMRKKGRKGVEGEGGVRNLSVTHVVKTDGEKGGVATALHRFRSFSNQLGIEPPPTPHPLADELIMGDQSHCTCHLFQLCYWGNNCKFTVPVVNLYYTAWFPPQ